MASETSDKGWRCNRFSRVSISLPQSRRDEASVRIRLSPQLHFLLEYLLMSDPERAVPVDELVEMLWPNPDTQPLTAARCVRTLVCHLRDRGIRILFDNRGYSIPRRNR